MNKIENIFWLFRCTEYQYAKSFLDNGCIKLNTPKSWIELEKSEGKGRGDLLEGIFAFTKFYDVNNVMSFKDQRQNTICESINGNVYMRSKDVLDLPCFCLFGLTDTSFKNNYFPETNVWATTTTIGTNYFGDFYKHETRESIMSLPKHERPVVVIIQSPNKFFNKIYDFFESIGISKNEVLIKKVDYINKSIPFIIRDNFPQEIFVKDTTFKHQSEIRIAINTKNKEALHKLSQSNYIVNIGSLKEFAIIHEYYLEDMFIELRNNTLRYVLPVPETTNLDDLSQEQMVMFIKNIENGEYIEDYEKKHIQEQITNIIQYYEKRFNEKVVISDEFWEKVRIG